MNIDTRQFIRWKRALHELLDDERTMSECGEWKAVRLGNTYVLTQYRYRFDIDNWEAFFSLTVPRTA